MSEAQKFPERCEEKVTQAKVVNTTEQKEEVEVNTTEQKEEEEVNTTEQKDDEEGNTTEQKEEESSGKGSTRGRVGQEYGQIHKYRLIRADS